MDCHLHYEQIYGQSKHPLIIQIIRWQRGCGDIKYKNATLKESNKPIPEENTQRICNTREAHYMLVILKEISYKFMKQLIPVHSK